MNPTDAEGDPVTAVSLDRSHSLFGIDVMKIVRDGESTLFKTYDCGQPAQIGFWKHAISSTMFRDFLLNLDGLIHAVPTDGVMMPGQMTTAFEVTREREVEPVRHSFHPNQPELPEVMARVSTIRDELRNHPSRVLRGEARWRSEVVKKGDIAMLDVILSNPGSERVQIENPAWEGGSETSRLRLFIRSEGGGNATVDVLTRDIQAIDAWAFTPELLLAPGQQVSFAVRTSLSAIDPGRCKTGLDIRSDLTKSAPREFVSGKLSIDMGGMTVTP